MSICSCVPLRMMIEYIYSDDAHNVYTWLGNKIVMQKKLAKHISSILRNIIPLYVLSSHLSIPIMSVLNISLMLWALHTADKKKYLAIHDIIMKNRGKFTIFYDVV